LDNLIIGDAWGDAWGQAFLIVVVGGWAYISPLRTQRTQSLWC